MSLWGKYTEIGLRDEENQPTTPTISPTNLNVKPKIDISSLLDDLDL